MYYCGEPFADAVRRIVREEIAAALAEREAAQPPRWFRDSDGDYWAVDGDGNLSLRRDAYGDRHTYAGDPAFTRRPQSSVQDEFGPLMEVDVP